MRYFVDMAVGRRSCLVTDVQSHFCFKTNIHARLSAEPATLHPVFDADTVTAIQNLDWAEFEPRFSVSEVSTA